MNIATKDGDQSGLHGEIQPTTAETKVFLEFPLGEKTSVMTAGRINYDLFGNFLWYSNNYFYDANFSLTHRFSQRNRLTFKCFTSNDHTNLDFNSLYRYLGNSIGEPLREVFNTMSIKWKNNWNNQVVSLIWNTMPLANLFVKMQISASIHHADNYSELVMKYDSLAFDTSTRLKSKVNDYSGKATFEYHLSPSNTLKTGVEYNRYSFFNQSELNRIESLNAGRRMNLFSLFLEDKAEIGGLTLKPGIRISNFNEQGFLYEPRLNLYYEAPGNLKLWAAWGQYYQYIISMNTQEFELNQFLDYYYPLQHRSPSASQHFMIGVEKKLGNNYLIRIDGYYKNMSRTYTFDLLQSQSEAFALSDKILEGTGRSKGI